MKIRVVKPKVLKQSYHWEEYLLGYEEGNPYTGNVKILRR